MELSTAMLNKRTKREVDPNQIVSNDTNCEIKFVLTTTSSNNDLAGGMYTPLFLKVNKSFLVLFNSTSVRLLASDLAKLFKP